MQKDTARATNHLACFLDDGNEENKVNFKKGSFVTLEQFQKTYNRHLELLKLRPQRVTDYCKFKERDYIVQKFNVCCKCGKPANKENCKCEGQPRRTQKKLIENMVVQTWNGGNWHQRIHTLFLFLFFNACVYGACGVLIFCKSIFDVWPF